MQRCESHARRLAPQPDPLAFLTIALTGLLLISTRSAEANYLDHDNSSHAAIAQAIEENDDRSALDQIELRLAAHPGDEVMLYNAACLHSRLDELDAAETRLREAIRAGFLRFSVMQRDPDLVPLRERPVYRALMQARDAADPIVTRRRIDDWRETHINTPYRFEHDDQRGIDYATVLPPPHFVDVREQIATLHDALCDQFFTHRLRHRILISLATLHDARRFFPDPHVHGVYQHGKRLLVVDDVGRPLMHELVHALHHAQMDADGQQHPMWIQEGLACLFESCAVQTDGGIAIYDNERDAIARSVLVRGAAPSWSELFAMPDDAFNAKPGEHYPLARSIMRFLYECDLLRRWIDAYEKTFNDDSTGAMAMEIAFGTSLVEVEGEWRAWAMRSESMIGPPIVMMVPLDEIDAVFDGATEIPAQPRAAVVDPDAARRAEAAALFDAIEMAHSARHAPEAVETLEQVVALDPGHTNARYALGLAQYRRGNVGAARVQFDALRELDRSLASLLGNLLRQDGESAGN